jgi:hypothetical protein
MESCPITIIYIFDLAFKVSPKASLAWVSLSLILPLLTNPLKARRAKEDGFVCVTPRLKFYTALESSLFPLLGNSTSRAKGIVKSLREHLLELNQAILDY